MRSDGRNMTVIFWFIFVLSLCTATYWCIQLIHGLRGVKQLKLLPTASNQMLNPPTPFVSVIISAKEEEQHIKQTIQHLLKQSYTNFEIIAVNDRSADQTGTRMEEIK